MIYIIQKLYVNLQTLIQFYDKENQYLKILPNDVVKLQNKTKLRAEGSTDRYNRTCIIQYTQTSKPFVYNTAHRILKLLLN